MFIPIKKQTLYAFGILRSWLPKGKKNKDWVIPTFIVLKVVYFPTNNKTDFVQEIDRKNLKDSSIKEVC